MPGKPTRVVLGFERLGCLDRAYIMNCSACGHEIETQATACPACGQGLQEDLPASPTPQGLEEHTSEVLEAANVTLENVLAFMHGRNVFTILLKALVARADAFGNRVLPPCLEVACLSSL